MGIFNFNRGHEPLYTTQRGLLIAVRWVFNLLVFSPLILIGYLWQSWSCALEPMVCYGALKPAYCHFRMVGNTINEILDVTAKSQAKLYLDGAVCSYSLLHACYRRISPTTQ